MENVPEALKFITPYYQRSKELKNHEPVIAYYCNYYAAKLAIAKGAKDKECQLFLVTLLDNLEQEKKSLGDNEAVNDDEIGKAYIESFAVKVFLNADNEDRAGKASKKTVKTFLAASIFLELMKIFGEVDPEIEEKIKYSKWKATDIMKALKEGRTPHPGPPGWEPSNENVNQDISTSEFQAADDDVPKIQDFPAPPTFSPQFDQYDQQSSNSPSVPPHLPQPDDGNNQDFSHSNANPNPNPYQSSQNFSSFPEFPTNPPSNIGHDGYPSQPSFDQSQASFRRNDFSEPPHPYGTQHTDHTPQDANPEPNSNFHSGISQYPSNDPYRYNMRPAQTDYQPQPSFHSPQQNYQQQQFTQEPSQDTYAKLDIDPKAISTAQKHSRFAISALEYDDVKTAVENLRKALMILEPYNRK